MGQSPKSLGGEGGKKVRPRVRAKSQKPEYLPGPPHFAPRFVSGDLYDRRLATTPREKTYSQKENESHERFRFGEKVRLSTIGGNCYVEMSTMLVVGRLFVHDRAGSLSRAKSHAVAFTDAD